MTWTDVIGVMLTGFGGGLSVWAACVFYSFVARFIRQGIDPDEHY